MLCECKCGLEVPRPNLRFFNKAHSRRHWMSTHPGRKKITTRRHYVKNRSAILGQNARWRAANPEKVAEGKRQWYGRNRERIKPISKAGGLRARERFKTLPEEKKRHIRDVKLRASKRSYQKNHEQILVKKRQWAKRDRPKLTAARRARIRGDVRLQIRERLTTRLKRVFKGQGRRSIQTLIGCTWDELKTHIESQFTEGMIWENRALWHIDHIRPCASFDFRNVEDQKRCFHYKNLQPLWALDNIRKGAKLPQEACV